MKNISCILLLLSLPLITLAQIKSIKVSEMEIPKVAHFIFEKKINVETNDTSNFIYIGWVNKKYYSITDISSISFSFKTDTSDVYEFIKDFKSALKYIETGTDLTWVRKNYSMSLPLKEDNKYLWLYEPDTDGGGYTDFNKKEIVKTIEWFESNGFKFGYVR